MSTWPRFEIPLVPIVIPGQRFGQVCTDSCPPVLRDPSRFVVMAVPRIPCVGSHLTHYNFLTNQGFKGTDEIRVRVWLRARVTEED